MLNVESSASWRGAALAALLFVAPFLRAADVPWAVPDAPFRALVHANRTAPTSPDAGYAIELPELGQTMPTLADIVLLDARNQYLPLAKVWRGEGQRAVLLA